MDHLLKSNKFSNWRTAKLDVQKCSQVPNQGRATSCFQDIQYTSLPKLTCIPKNPKKEKQEEEEDDDDDEITVIQC